MDWLKESFENYVDSLKVEEKSKKDLIVPAFAAHYGGPGPSADTRIKDSSIYLDRRSRERSCFFRAEMPN